MAGDRNKTAITNAINPRNSNTEDKNNAFSKAISNRNEILKQNEPVIITEDEFTIYLDTLPKEQMQRFKDLISNGRIIVEPNDLGTGEEAGPVRIRRR